MLLRRVLFCPIPANCYIILPLYMADNDSRIERIKHLTEVFRFGWVSLLAVGSGTLGLLRSVDRTPVGAVLTGLGLLACVGAIVVLLVTNRRINVLIRL